MFPSVALEGASDAFPRCTILLLLLWVRAGEALCVEVAWRLRKLFSSLPREQLTARSQAHSTTCRVYMCQARRPRVGGAARARARRTARAQHMRTKCDAVWEKKRELELKQQCNGGDRTVIGQNGRALLLLAWGRQGQGVCRGKQRGTCAPRLQARAKNGQYRRRKRRLLHAYGGS